MVQPGNSWFHHCSYWRLPFPVSRSTPSSVSPWATSQINYLPRNSCLGVAFWGSPSSDSTSPYPCEGHNSLQALGVSPHWPELCPPLCLQCLACSRCSINDPKSPSSGGQVVTGSSAPTRVLRSPQLEGVTGQEGSFLLPSYKWQPPRLAAPGHTAWTAGPGPPGVRNPR